jgi:excisionase family DNA binding protein
MIGRNRLSTHKRHGKYLLITRKEAPMSESSQPATYTVEEAAKLLRIGRNQAYDAARTGTLPSIKIGKRILVPRAALERMLAQPRPAAA